MNFELHSKLTTVTESVGVVSINVSKTVFHIVFEDVMGLSEFENDTGERTSDVVLKGVYEGALAQHLPI